MLPSDLETEGLQSSLHCPRWLRTGCEVQGHRHPFFPQPWGEGVSVACSLGGITSSSKEAFYLRGNRPLPTTNARATCLGPGRRRPATEESSLRSLVLALLDREHLIGKPVDCQSLLSKQEPGLRVINHAPSDRNPGPYRYPKKCRWSPVPSSIKETDSPNKEAPYQISGREPGAAQWLCGKGFYEGLDPVRLRGSWALTLGGGNAAGHRHWHA